MFIYILPIVLTIEVPIVLPIELPIELLIELPIVLPIGLPIVLPIGSYPIVCASEKVEASGLVLLRN